MGVYRFTYTGKWEDEWFYELDNNSRCLWSWLTDHADIGGFLDFPGYMKLQDALKVGKPEVQRMLGMMEKPCVFSQGPNHLKYIWLRNFVRHQKNYPIYVKKGAHRSIVKKYLDMKEIFWFNEEFREFFTKHIEPSVKIMEEYYAMLKDKREGKVGPGGGSRTSPTEPGKRIKRVTS